MTESRAGRPPAVDAAAEHLPFDDDSFDAAMATFTVHQVGHLGRRQAGLLGGENRIDVSFDDDGRRSAVASCDVVGVVR